MVVYPKKKSVLVSNVVNRNSYIATRIYMIVKKLKKS